VLDGCARSRVLGPDLLEEAEDVLGARRRPQGEQVVVLVRQGPAAADRHETGVPDLREDHGHTILGRRVLVVTCAAR
jgi:hypothetical protein